MKNYLLLLLFSGFCFQPIAISQVITIGNGGDYLNLEAVESVVVPGDTLLLLAQVFSDGAQFLENLNGTALSPIVIIAEHEHQSIFRGGTEAIHLINCSHIELNGLIVEQQTGNGINIDDGGDYSTPSKHITVRNCIFRDMDADGNNDLLKMSGVDSFLIEKCSFLYGGNGGSGIDFVGCHWGIVQDCYFDEPGSSGIQNKGGSQFIRIQRNIFRNVSQRALNLGGSTGLQYFRPPLSNPIKEAFEAADLEVFSNVFIGCWAPIAYVGCVRVKVYNNTFYHPENWVIRILQETTIPGFLPCRNNEFRNNIISVSQDMTEVNIGPNTESESFIFSNNLWYNSSNNSWSPQLPVSDINQVLEDPLFEDELAENFRLQSISPAINGGLTLGMPEKDFDQALFHQPPSIGAFEGRDVVSKTNYLNLTNDILVLPNPFSKSIQIEGQLRNATIWIVNHMGCTVLNYVNVNDAEHINLEDLPNGIYFLIIDNPKFGKMTTKRIVKLSN